MFVGLLFSFHSSNQTERDCWDFIFHFMFFFFFCLAGDSAGIDAEGVLQTRESRSVSPDFGGRI